jgi:hypothetical protein
MIGGGATFKDDPMYGRDTWRITAQRLLGGLALIRSPSSN